MIQIAKQWWRDTAELPALLSALVRAGMVVGPILLLGILLPFAHWEVDGRDMARAEVWRSGVGVAATAVVMFVCAGSWALAARRPFSRWLLAVAPLVPYIVLAASQYRSEADLLVPVVSAAATSALIAWYLFGSRRVRAYIAAGNPRT